MNNRIITVVACAILVTLTSGCCGSMRSFCFGRGARCGLCRTNATPQFGNVMQAPCPPQQYVPPPQYVAPPQYATPRRPGCFSGHSRPGPCATPQRQSAPCQAPPCQSAPCQSAPPNDCGCNSYAQGAYSEPCGSCHSSGYGDCGCGSTVDGYAGVVQDPYLTGGVPVMRGGSSGYPMGPQPGEMINGEVVVGPGQMGPGQMGPGQSGQVSPGAAPPMSPDNFQQRSGDVYPQGTYPQGSGTGGNYPQSNYQSRKFDTDGKKILWESPLPAGSNAL